MKEKTLLAIIALASIPVLVNPAAWMVTVAIVAVAVLVLYFVPYLGELLVSRQSGATRAKFAEKRRHARDSRRDND